MSALADPSARELRRCGHAIMPVIMAHNRELARHNARAANRGWIISETGITSKTSVGILETNKRSGAIEHLWSR